MLITTTEDLQKYVEVSADLDIRSVTPSLKKAERRFIMPILGAFYNEVQAMVDAPTADAVELQLIDLINCATGPLAMWYYVRVGGVSVDNSGIYKPKNNERWNLGDKEQAGLESAMLSYGLDALDDLLVFLNMPATLTKFPNYATSDPRVEHFSTLVPTASVVQKVFSMLHPQVTYRALRESIKYVEPRVADVMQEFYQYLIDKPVADLTPSEKRMRDAAERAIIYMAVSRALLTRMVKFTNEGMEVIINDRVQVSEAENARIETVSGEYGRSGAVELDNLITLMNANPPTGYVVPVVVPIADRCVNGEGNRILFF